MTSKRLERKAPATLLNICRCPPANGAPAWGLIPPPPPPPPGCRPRRRTRSPRHSPPPFPRGRSRGSPVWIQILGRNKFALRKFSGPGGPSNLRPAGRPICDGAPARGLILPLPPPPPGCHPRRRTRSPRRTPPPRRRGRAPAGRTDSSRPAKSAPGRTTGSPPR